MDEALSVIVDVGEPNQFGNIELCIPIDEFNRRGFCFGDALDVHLSNGYAFREIPYYPAFIGPGSQPCVYGFAQAYTNIGIGFPVFGNPWEASACPQGCTARIDLAERGKYKQELDLFRLDIRPERPKNMSVQAWANFRPLLTDHGPSPLFFRGASPVRSDVHCSQAANMCVTRLQPGFVLNLSDSVFTLQNLLANSPGSFYQSLFEKDHVAAFPLGVDFSSRPYAQQLAQGLTRLAHAEGPFFIHCKYGVDRTGFACVLLEALAGTAEKNIAEDFMASYANVYGLNPESATYCATQQRRFGEVQGYLRGLSGKGSLKQAARIYLQKAGMREHDLETLCHLLAR